MDPGYRYGGEALFFIGIAARLIPWLIRTASEIENDDRPNRTAFSSLMAPMSPAPVIADPPRLAEHHCPKCGTLIHADIVHGGFGPCRKCGWAPDQH